MKVSIITVCFNSEKTIERTINSVLSQNYSNIEYIIVDGDSKDSTIQIIEKYKNSIQKLVSEKDDGIYDAINKGISISTGDIVGILNSDDIFSNQNIITDVAKLFIEKPQLDSIIGNIAFINDKEKIVRVYNSKSWRPNRFEYGFMPPHPSFYCKRELFHKFGGYKKDYKIAADYELLIRFLKIHQISYYQLNTIMVYMNLGGVSTNGFKSTFLLNHEVKRACLENGLSTNYLKLYSKYFLKILEYITIHK
ncbi:MAG: glycosyltransferase family 2 protein [Chitinophagia bacterium]